MEQTCGFQNKNERDYTLYPVPSEFIYLYTNLTGKICTFPKQRTNAGIIDSLKRLFGKLHILSLILMLIQPSIISGQEYFNKNNYRLEIPKIFSKTEIDGILNEPAWNSAGASSITWLYYPIDNGKAYAETKIKMMYDEYNLYIGFVSLGSTAKPVVQSLKRDDEANSGNNDGVVILIDPSNSARNGYFFRINAAGAMVDGVVNQNGMYPSGSIYWNNKWLAKTRQSHDSLYYEITIPFSSIKYNDENNTWGINFLRIDVTRDIKYAWTPLPANKHELDLGFTGSLVFSDGLTTDKSKKIIIVPSVTSGITRNDEVNKKNTYHLKAGMDAKVAISSSLNFDLSAYPDFSNVAVDEQYIDFYRFEYYQPEQRGLFLENNDLFTSFGSYDDFNTSASENRVKPVYTRHIGKNGKGEDVPIVYGARLSGEIAGNTRVGLLNIQTEKSGIFDAQNYLIGSFQKGVFKRSAVKGLFTNRSSNNKFDFRQNDYNRNGGLEYDYSSEDGKWTANARMHASFTDEHYNNNLFYGGGFTFFKKEFKTQNWVEHVDKNYITDIGFVPRLYHKDPISDTTYRFGYTHFTNKYELYQYVTNNLVTVMGEYTNFHTYLSDNNKLNEFSFDLGYWSVFANRMLINIQGTYNRFNLLVPQDVLNNNYPVPTGTYENTSVYIRYESDARKKFKFNTIVTYGGFYKGRKLTITAGPSYTFQPFGTIALIYNYTDIDLNNGYGKATYHLAGLKPEISFSTKLLWTTLIQYNSQLDNINFNSILQWRFAPMSDFYIILKNDTSRSLENKEFELSFKLTYWLNL